MPDFSYSGLTLVTNPFSALISVGGIELTDSRRYADLFFASAARVQFKATGPISVRVEYSLDGGARWDVLVPEDNYVGVNPYLSGWQIMPVEARTNDCLLRAVGIGSGLLLTIHFVELSFR